MDAARARLRPSEARDQCRLFSSTYDFSCFEMFIFNFHKMLGLQSWLHFFPTHYEIKCVTTRVKKCSWETILG